jgi:hypothetical protein
MSTPTYDTLEKAQEAILDLQNRVTELTNERDTLSQNNNQMTQELASVRTLNQKYFNKLSAQFQDQEGKNDNEDKEAPSCEDFAKTLNIL